MKKLKPYQITSLAYSLQETHPALFLEMRLGKTIITIRRVKLIGSGPVLVVAPNSALGGWEEELTGEGLRYKRLIGTREQRLHELECLEYSVRPDWFLINKEGFLSVPEIKFIFWKVVILDESTFIKNPKAKVTNFFLNNFKHIKHKFILTGLPNPESDLDYACQFIFLDGHFCWCKNYWEFRDKFFIPGGYNGHDWIPKPGAAKAIQKYIGERAFILKRKEAGMRTEKIYENRYIDFDPATRKIYKEAEEDFVLKAGAFEKKTIWKMVQYTWLRQLTGGWLGKEKLIFDGKIKELKALLQGELLKEPVIVWFNYNTDISSAYKILTEKPHYAREITFITGLHTTQEREKRRREFLAGKVRVLLIQQKIAETGMDLSAADTAIYFSEPLGLFGKKQTEDRILHPNKSVPLLYIHLLVNDSVDIDIRFALAQKALRADSSIYESLKYSMEKRRIKG